MGTRLIINTGKNNVNSRFSFLLLLLLQVHDARTPRGRLFFLPFLTAVFFLLSVCAAFARCCCFITLGRVQRGEGRRLPKIIICHRLCSMINTGKNNVNFCFVFLLLLQVYDAYRAVGSSFCLSFPLCPFCYWFVPSLLLRRGRCEPPPND